MIRDSGSVKLYWAFESGFADSPGFPAAAASSFARGSSGSLGFANPLQPTLASLQVRRQFVAAVIRAVLRVLGGVRGFRVRGRRW